MLEANELMIGNYVYTKHIVTCKYDNVRKVSETILVNLSREKDYLKPIPLTEEWLIKLGFKKLDGGCLIFQKGIYEIWSNTADLKEWSLRRIVGDKNEGSYGETLNCMVNVHNKVYTVHQLQNIYYSLTGEQLTIK